MGKRKESPSGRLVVGSSFVTNAFETSKTPTNQVKSPGKSKTNKSEKLESEKDNQPGTFGKPGKSSEGTPYNKEKVNDDKKEKESE
jgi:hypothetical protein